MPLPTPDNKTNLPVETDRTPVKRDFNDLDNLLGEMNVKKEVINSSPRPASTSSANGAPSSDNQGQPLDEPVEAMPPEVAALSGKTIANTIDTALGTGLSMYAKNTQPEKYQATDKQIGNLENAWAAVASKYNYKIEDSPWFNVILLTVAVYLPHFQEAKADRRFAEMDEKYKTMQKLTEDMEARLKTVEAQTKAA